MDVGWEVRESFSEKHVTRFEVDLVWIHYIFSTGKYFNNSDSCLNPQFPTLSIFWYIAPINLITCSILLCADALLQWLVTVAVRHSLNIYIFLRGFL